MNRNAYLTTNLALKAFSGFSRSKINIHDKQNIPKGSIIYVINHFTRIETIFLPHNIFKITGIPVWSLADSGLFKGAFGNFLESVGAVSTKDPDRDLLIVKTLLTGEASWIIFPEGRMVKSKKTIEDGVYMVDNDGEKHPPRTGAAALALRTEFYRQRFLKLYEKKSDEVQRLLDLYHIDSIDSIINKNTYIVPVNITYYPMRAKENAISNFASSLINYMPERITEELMTEGTMLLSGVDIDIRFGKPFLIKKFLTCPQIREDIASTNKINFDDPIPSRPEMKKIAKYIMNCYMDSIYNMTTVNSEHIFASMIKLMKQKKINIEALKQRVFLISYLLKQHKGSLYLHNDLKHLLIHLLSDDRYNTYKEFITLAKEKYLLKKKGKFLIKNSSKFSDDFDFHSIRIENPIEVMANEVEPLSLLQRYIKNIAKHPDFLIRLKTIYYLYKKGNDLFKKDYNKYFIKGESKSKDIGKPFLLPGRSFSMGVLLIHGYMAAPAEVKGLAKYLARKGLWVYVPRIRGHGTSPEDLAKRVYFDWTESVDAGYALISSICRRVIVGGFSTGGGLALELASRVKNLSGVFAVSPPMKLNDISTKFVPAVAVWNRIMNKVKIDGAKKEFVVNNPENPHINYFRNPISGVRELDRLMKFIESRLPKIKIPAHIVQAINDPVVNPMGSKKVFELLGSENKKYVLLNFNRHGILLGKGCEQVYEDVYSFIKKL